MTEQNYKVISVLGDSIADGYFDGRGLGWLMRLSEKLNADNPNSVFFNNFAVSGDRIFDVWHRLGSLTMKNEADALFFAVGVNDTYRFGGRDAPPSMAMDMRRYYWYQTLKFAKKLVPEIYVFGMLPVVEARIPARTDDFGTEMFYRNDDIELYNSRIKEWCDELGVNFISFHDNMSAVPDRESLMEDDVHPNAAGHELLAKWAYDTLRDQLVPEELICI